MTPIVSTRRLFAKLLQPLEVTTICDVGSMDGTESKYFRRHCPSAAIVAFEPNPRNFELMQKDEGLRSSGIRVVQLAASDQESEAQFFIHKAEYTEKDRLRRGMSSLHRRASHGPQSEVATVRTVRLDRLLPAEGLADGALALWIDTEGFAYEVIRGAEGVLPKTRMLHVEVETTAVIGSGQHLFPDVLRALEQAGFELVATDCPVDHVQFNALFVRRDLVRAHAGAIRARLALTWIPRNARRMVSSMIPDSVRQRLR